MKKTIIFLSAFLPLLTSCKTVQIRSEISEFLASFSLDESIKTYLEGGLEKISITTEEGVGIIKEVETLSFNVKNASDPHYKKVITTYKDNEIVDTSSEEIIKENDIFYLYEISKDKSEKNEKTLEECHDLVKKFFYTQTAFEGTYHSGGYFYGDYIKQGIEYFQPYVTIKDELYTYEYSEETKDKYDHNLHKEIKYSVNKLGMAETHHLLEYTASLSKSVDIKTYRI